MCACNARTQAGLGASPAFRVPEYELQSVWELPLVLALGALCGLASSAFTASTQVPPQFHQNTPPQHLQAPAHRLLLQDF
jgi:H+/Cl- antiporter ClcA